MLLLARTLRVPRIFVMAVLATAAIIGSAGLTACGADGEDSDGTGASATTTTNDDHGDHHVQAPAPEALQATLDTMVDPAVPAEDKTNLLVNGEKRRTNVEQMNSALAGYGKLTFAVADVSTENTTATAQVTITSPHGAAPAMPLTWEHQNATWKLSDDAGCLLFSFAKAPCTPA